MTSYSLLESFATKTPMTATAADLSFLRIKLAIRTGKPHDRHSASSVMANDFLSGLYSIAGNQRIAILGACSTRDSLFPGLCGPALLRRPGSAGLVQIYESNEDPALVPCAM